MACGRVSHLLGLTGQCLALDTACSAALAAVHLGGKSLQLGGCSGAATCTAGLLVDPGVSVTTGVAGMLSPRGRTHTFDSRADGYGRAEGAVAAAMLSRSEANDEALPACVVMLGIAIQQDGASASLTAPNGTSQRRLMRVACDEAGVDPSTFR